MRNKSTGSTDTAKSDAPASTRDPKQRGAEKESEVQKDTMARSRGESPTANKPSERSPREENL